MTKSMKKAISLCLFSMGAVGLMAQSNEFKIDVQKTGAPIQSTMYGIFFEDINYGADGGLDGCFGQVGDGAEQFFFCGQVGSGYAEGDAKGAD
jgi:hypothetical protein